MRLSFRTKKDCEGPIPHSMIPSRVVSLECARDDLLIADQQLCDAYTSGEPVLQPRLSVEAATLVHDQAEAAYRALLVRRTGAVQQLIDF